MKEKVKLPSLKGQRILITGGLGFIGSNLALECVKLGAEVTIYDCLDPRSGGNIYNIHDIRKNIRLCFHNILEFDLMCQGIDKQDVVFNCAASTSHPFSMREPWIDMDVNGRGVINILEAIRRFNGDAKLIHLGTTTQLGKLIYEPADENHPEFPTDIYSANKCVSEKYVMIYAKAYGIRASIMRLSNVFGPRACIHSADFTFNNYFVGLAFQGKDITVYGEGSQKRNVIFVDDVVAALILASQADAVNGQTYFVVSDEHLSVAEIARATASCFGRNQVKHVEWPKGKQAIDVGDAIISNAKIKKTLNWCPCFTLHSGLQKTKSFYVKHGKDYLR